MLRGLVSWLNFGEEMLKWSKASCTSIEIPLPSNWNFNLPVSWL